MRKLMVVLVVFLSVQFINAQDNIVEKNVEYQQIDKQSKIAFIYQGDVLVEKGLLVDGKRHGVWQSFNEDGTLATEVSFEMGVKEGMWNIYKDAQLMYVLQYKDNALVKVENLALVD